jgi:hypothetical protein
MLKYEKMCDTTVLEEEEEEEEKEEVDPSISCEEKTSVSLAAPFPYVIAMCVFILACNPEMSLKKMRSS